MKKIILFLAIICYMTPANAMDEFNDLQKDLKKKIDQLQKDTLETLRQMLTVQVNENEQLKKRIKDLEESNFDRQNTLIQEVQKNLEIATANQEQQKIIKQNNEDLEFLGETAQKWYDKLTYLDVKNQEKNNEIKLWQHYVLTDLIKRYEYKGYTITKYSAEKHKKLDNKCIFTTQGNPDLPKYAKVMTISSIKEKKKEIEKSNFSQKCKHKDLQSYKDVDINDNDTTHYCLLYNNGGPFVCAGKLDTTKISHVVTYNE